MKFLYLDFEFNGTTEKRLNLVCCTTLVDGEYKDWWLHKDNNTKEALQRYLVDFDKKEYIFVAYAVEAEARSLMSLALNPLAFKWIDLYVEYRHLLNHNHKLSYGKQLIKGVVRNTTAPKNKWDMTEEQKRRFDMSKPEYNLASCCFKLLDVKIDTDFKDSTRDLIISAPKRFTKDEQETIMRYCQSDVKYLPRLLERVLEEYRRLPSTGGNRLQQMHRRAEYSARTAKMVSLGYPINHKATQNFSGQVFAMLWELQHEINMLFPDISPFELDKKTYKYVWKQKKTKDYLRENLPKTQLNNWTKTDKKDLSLSLDAFEKFYPYRHDFPKDCFYAQMVRFLKFKRQLNGFLPSTGKKKTFWDSVGTDERVRPYFGIFGSQSSRSQPSATGFLHLKSSWMRSLCEAKEGRTLGAIDYGSEEFLLAALCSGDDSMFEAYKSGDPYLYFAKLAGAVPWDGTKAEYKEERDLFKSTTLGLSYGMGEKLLAVKLTMDTGKKVSEQQASNLIHKFKKAYPKYERYKYSIEAKYRKNKYLQLPCGWTMWGDNRNMKSVTNFPLQGMGASIMRKAVALSQDCGLDVILTLHDALYIEFDTGDLRAMDILAECMKEAFMFYFNDDVRKKAEFIRLDANIWSKDLSDGNFKTPKGMEGKQQNIYIDERSEKEYEKFSKYFSEIDYNSLDL